jgi:hypothetical protein
MLAFYSVSSEMSGITVGGWVFTVFVLADVMDHEAADLDYQLKSFAKGFLHAEPHLETHEAAHIFRRFVTGH